MNNKRVQQGTGLVLSLLFVTGMGIGILGRPTPVAADSLDDLRARLQEKRSAVQNIEEQIKKYQATVAKKRSEAVTLGSQIDVIQDGIGSLTLQLDKTNAEAASVRANIQETNEEVRLAQEDIDRQRLLLKEYLRELEALDANSPVEVFFKYPTLSQAMQELRALFRVQQQSQETLERITSLQNTLKERAQAFTDLQRELEGLKARQETQKQTLNDQQNAKQRLLDITAKQEKQYAGLLQQSVAARKAANAEIARIDAQIRAELEKQGGKGLGTVGEGSMDWPIDPIFGISCGFHCPGYPYAYLIGPHTGNDMPTPIGTPIHAPADGYVAKVQIAAGAGFSYILIIHGNGISTMYGHISATSVQEGQYVTRGQTLGTTGGAPGSRGAGLSTGPHLHFEVRLNGIPTNPLRYLAPRSLQEGATGVYS